MRKTIAAVWVLAMAGMGPARAGVPTAAEVAYSELQYSLGYKDWGSAVTHIRKILALEPDRWDMHRLAGECLMKRRQPAQALDHFREWVRLQPDSAEAAAALELAADGQRALDRRREARERERETVRRLVQKPSLAAAAREARGKSRAMATVNAPEPAPSERMGRTTTDIPGVDRDAAYAAALGFAAEQLVDDRPTLCVAVGDKDPTDAFLKEIRYAGPLRKASECETTAKGVSVRGGSGQAALWLGTVSVDRVSADEIWVELRYVRTDVIRGIRQYRVVRKSSAWVTLGQVMKGMPL